MNQQSKIPLSKWLQHPALAVIVVFGGSTIRGGHHLMLWFAISILLLFYSHYWRGKLVLDKWLQLYGGLAVFSLFSLGWASEFETGWLVVVRILTCFLFMWTIQNSLRDSSEVILFLKSFCLILSVVVLYALFGPSGEEDSEFSIGSKNTIGPLAFSLLLVNVVLWIMKVRLYIATLPIAVATIVGSTSLKTFLALLVFATAIVAISAFDIKRMARIYKLGLVATLLLFLGISVTDITRFASGYEKIEGRLKRYSEEIGFKQAGYAIDTSSQIELRSQFVSTGIRYFWDSPLLGHGANQFRVMLGKETGRETYSHNTFIELLVGFGLPGFLMFVFFLIGYAKVAWQSRRDPVGTLMLSYFLAFVVIGSGQEVTFHLPFLVLMVVTRQYFLMSASTMPYAIAPSRMASTATIGPSRRSLRH